MNEKKNTNWQTGVIYFNLYFSSSSASSYRTIWRIYHNAIEARQLWIKKYTWNKRQNKKKLKKNIESESEWKKNREFQLRRIYILCFVFCVRMNAVRLRNGGSGASTATVTATVCWFHKTIMCGSNESIAFGWW